MALLAGVIEIRRPKTSEILNVIAPVTFSYSPPLYTAFFYDLAELLKAYSEYSMLFVAPDRDSDDTINELSYLYTLACTLVHLVDVVIVFFFRPLGTLYVVFTTLALLE